MVVPAAVAIATANPIGLIVVGGAKIYGETSGGSGLEGRAKATADEIAERLRMRFQDRGWIQSANEIDGTHRWVGEIPRPTALELSTH
jgi:hypothetical protein